MSKNKKDHDHEGERVALTSEQTKGLALKQLQETIPLGTPDGYKPQDLWGVLVEASANETSIERAADQLESGPSANTVRNWIDELDLDRIQNQINEGLRDRIPQNLLERPKKVAVDLTRIPYYGETTSKNQAYVTRSQAKEGTTHFFTVASLYVIEKNKRVTLAVRFVKKEDDLLGILKFLLHIYKELGGRVKRLYADRAFYQVRVLSYLKEEGVPFVILVPARGSVKNLFGGAEGKGSSRKSYFTPYTVKSQDYGQVEVKMAVVCSYSMGNRNKHELQWHAYATYLFDRPVLKAAQEYEKRFGIESSYCLMNQARARTSSRKPLVRFLFTGIAFLLINLWVYLKWKYVSWSRRGGRRVFSERFPFQKMLLFLSRELEDTYGLTREVRIPIPPKSNPTGKCPVGGDEM